MARTSEDCALILNAIAGPDPSDPASSPRPVHDFTDGLGNGIKGLRIGVVRHWWEKDAPVSAELAKALETAISVLRDLGAVIDDVTLRPLQAYSDVKIVTAESELFSLHLKELIARPHEFGQDFRARALGALMFTAEDYVRASRERRAILGEMRPLYQRDDLFLTANGSPAPRLDKHDILSFWRRGNFTSPFNCTGGPALSVLCGFSSAGLPLALQIAGRPFDDATVLRAGHAYEKAAGFITRHPALKAGEAPAALDVKPWVPDTKDVPADVRRHAEDAAKRASLKLPEAIMEELVAVAPLALAMARRLDRSHPQQAEVCSIFDPARDVDID
jgi:aspartyl-tRNA(Asn)/glutamyl-tRNA(Gln) amidotransferase subunit A